MTRTKRTDATEQRGRPAPRVVRLQRLYGLSEPEKNMFECLLVMQASKSELIEWHMRRLKHWEDPMSYLKTVCAVSSLDLKNFKSDDRVHVEEGIIQAPEDEYNPGIIRMQLMHEAAQYLIGGSEYGEEELVKFNKTAIQTLVTSETASEQQKQQRVEKCTLLADPVGRLDQPDTQHAPAGSTNQLNQAINRESTESFHTDISLAKPTIDTSKDSRAEVTQSPNEASIESVCPRWYQTRFKG